MFKKILVPLDGSPLSERALEPALTLAQSHDGEMIVLRVLVPESERLVMPVGHLEQARREARSYLDAIKHTRARPPILLETRSVEVEGDVAGVIVDTATNENDDLIVMSTHGYSGVTRWILGSVTEKVLCSAPCPVLAIRSPRPIHRLVIALDGSERAERAIEPGLEIAKRFNAEVTFLRVVPHVAVGESLEERERGLSRRLQQDWIDEARAYLNVRAAHYQSNAKIDTEVRVGLAAEHILEFVETYGTDLVVMATHGRTGLQRWVYGSVTAKVLRSVNCSMLVIRPAAGELH